LTVQQIFRHTSNATPSFPIHRARTAIACVLSTAALDIEAACRGTANGAASHCTWSALAGDLAGGESVVALLGGCGDHSGVLLPDGDLLAVDPGAEGKVARNDGKDTGNYASDNSGNVRSRATVR
jgi:hypothetical protein